MVNISNNPVSACPPQEWKPQDLTKPATEKALNRFSVEGKNAAVTGGASGMALDATYSLLEHGLSGVVLIDVDAVGLTKAAQDLHQLYPDRQIWARQCDVSNSEELKEAVCFSAENLGSINIVLAFAGIRGAPNQTGRPDVEDLNRLMKVNCSSVYNTCKLFGENMIKKETRGSIILASSTGGHGMYGVQNKHPLPLPVDYVTSKTTLLGIRFSMAISYVKYGIRVNSISPGWMETPFIEPLLNIKEFNDSWLNSIPMARFGKRGEANGAILLLASDAGSYITGADIRIDGGLSSQA